MYSQKPKMQLVMLCGNAFKPIRHSLVRCFSSPFLYKYIYFFKDTHTHKHGHAVRTMHRFIFDASRSQFDLWQIAIRF